VLREIQVRIGRRKMQFWTDNESITPVTMTMMGQRILSEHRLEHLEYGVKGKNYKEAGTELPARTKVLANGGEIEEAMRKFIVSEILSK
jgi:hypothetical protein